MNIPLFSTRAQRLGAVLLATSFALSGCGGGGSSGPKIDTGTPPAGPTSNNGNQSCTNETYTPNYVNSVRLLHWPSFPLRVFFKRDSNYSAARQALAVKGFNRWVAATGNDGFTYNLVSSAAAANITVNFYDFRGGAGDTLGSTLVSFYDESDTIEKADISIGITKDNTNDLLTATHEMGHALGIYGHSPNRSDLMFFEGNEADGGVITPLDLNTVLTAYCGNFSKNPNARTAPHRGELKTIRID